MARRRPAKKKSSNGVWVGSAISGGILIVICIALFFKFQPGPPDRASGSITQANLAKQTLQTNDLPDLGNAPGGSGSFDELLNTIDSAKNVMRSGGFEEEKAAKSREVVQALHGAAASSLPANALDAKIPEKYFDSPEMQSAISVLGSAVRREVDRHIDDVQFDQAQAIGVSYLQLGMKIFEKNERLKSRQRGLAMMKSALSTLGKVNRARFDDGEIDEDELAKANERVMAWNKVIGDFEKSWNSKLKTTESVNAAKNIPNITDLIKIANEDEDLTFRRWAALRLGYALYERGDQGNQDAIKAAIETLKNDSNKLVAKAATEGESIKDSDEYYELRK